MQTKMTIPFCKSTIGEEEKRAICEVVDSGWLVQGPKVKEFEEKFAEFVGAKYAVMVNSGTSALDLSIKYYKKQKLYRQGDPLHDTSIKVPSLTFTATVEVAVHNSWFRFVDVGDDMLINSDDPLAIPVHLCGKKKEGNFFIEDSAHMILPGQCKDSMGLVCFSLYMTKNMTSVQGGVIATNSEEAAKWLRLARDHGVTRDTEARYKGGSWKYDIEFVGWRYKSDDLAASIAIEQLKKLPWMNKERQRIIDRYNELLGYDNKGLHLYPVLVNDRDKFIEFMKSHNIQVSVHFLPLHSMTAYKKIVGEVSLPRTEWFGERLVSLPLFPTMTPEEVDYVAEKALESGLLTHEKYAERSI